MRSMILWLAHVLFNWRINICECGFSEIAHSHPHLEWDINRYPCATFKQGETE